MYLHEWNKKEFWSKILIPDSLLICKDGNTLSMKLENVWSPCKNWSCWGSLSCEGIKSMLSSSLQQNKGAERETRRKKRSKRMERVQSLRRRWKRGAGGEKASVSRRVKGQGSEPLRPDRGGPGTTVRCVCALHFHIQNKSKKREEEENKRKD